MKRHCFVIVIAMMLVGLAVAGCAKSTPAPAPTAVGRSTPTAVQVAAKGFTPGAVCMIPNVIGLDEGAAEGMLIKLGLQPVITNQYDASAAAGIVLVQQPVSNTRLEPCKGDVVLKVSLGPVPKPTNPPPTPAPSATATLKATPSPTASPLPTSTPTVTPLPTPSNRMFFDDFETGIQPTWNMRGNYGLVNGDLVVAGEHVEGSVGNKTWSDYEITLDIASVDNFELAIRIQDADNYIRFRWWYDNGAYFNWAKVVGGKEMQIPASGVKAWACCTYPSNRNVRIEIRGSNYRVFINGDQQLSFIDPTFADGGIGFKSKGITLRSFEVRNLK